MSGRASVVSLLWRQTRAQNRAFWRVPIGAFFTLGLPLIMLVLFVALFGNDPIDSAYGSVKTAQFYAPGLAVFAAASATYTNIGMNLSMRRDEGILKRVRGTPLPPWIYLAGVVLSAVWIALVSTVVMMGLGVLVYDVNIEAAKMPAAALAFVVGTVCFALLGVALAAVAKSASAAPGIANSTILPLAFVSQVFISLGESRDVPGWLETLGNIFPLKHFALAFGEAFNPFSDSPAIEWGHLGVMVIWAAIGAVVAWRKFGWDPHPGAQTRRARRGSRSAA